MNSYLLVLLMFLLLGGGFAQTPAGVAINTTGWIPFPLAAFKEMKGTALDMS